MFDLQLLSQSVSTLNCFRDPSPRYHLSVTKTLSKQASKHPPNQPASLEMFFSSKPICFFKVFILSPRQGNLCNLAWQI